ncbi:MAG: iron ABC transporter permease [Bacteroidales bacterium]|nr:iron ABC transporter permease [Bacteroidales bacterium]
MKKGKAYIWAAGAGLLVLMIAADLACGGEAGAQVLLHLRTPRVLTALLAGASLALAGGQMQSVLRNPLADPHIMGVSAGAALGAALATMLGGHSLPGIFNGITIAAAAFAGALSAAAIILLASRRFRTASSLLIFGVMLGFIVNALVAILQFSSDAESLKMFYSWSAGSFSNAGWNEIGILTVTLATGLAGASFNSKGLDIILFGDEFAAMSGAPVQRIRLRAILGCSLMTATVTAFCGLLGFVGIVAPHMARGIFRTSSHRTIIPACMLTGSMTALAADLLSQISSAPLPVASTMAIVGVPVILYILLKGRGYGE